MRSQRIITSRAPAEEFFLRTDQVLHSRFYRLAELSQYTYLLDGHTHTNMSDGHDSIHDNMDTSRRLLVESVVTDHNIVYNGTANIFGSEITAIFESGRKSRTGHLIGISPYPFDINSKSSRAKDVIKHLHDQDVRVVAAHPLNYPYKVMDLLEGYDIDWVEINASRSLRKNLKVKEFADDHNLPLVGGSDAHEIRNLGSGLSIFKRPPKNSRDVIDMIDRGQNDVYHEVQFMRRPRRVLEYFVYPKDFINHISFVFGRKGYKNPTENGGPGQI